MRGGIITRALRALVKFTFFESLSFALFFSFLILNNNSREIKGGGGFCIY